MEDIMTFASTTTPFENKYARSLVRSFLAGMAISIGGCVYLNCDVKFVGAVLFSVGLITVCAFNLDLYTGKVGYWVGKPASYGIGLVLIIFGNFIGCLVAGTMMPYDAAAALVDAKLNLEPMTALFKGIMCGILMFIAVDFYKQRNSFIGIVFCVPVFILAGFEHSIADMFYFFSAGVYSIDAAVFILIVIVGNAIGGLLVPFCRQFMTEPESS